MACTQRVQMYLRDVEVQKIIIIYYECEGMIEKSVPLITIWHNKTCRVMTSGDYDVDFFYLTLSQIMDTFSCLPSNSTFYFKE